NLVSRFYHRFRIFGMTCTAVLLASCAPSGHTSAAGNNQIMLVRPEPPSFGFQRLTSLAIVHPDLGTFVSRHGTPNFLGETSNDERLYYFLYYLGDREAFVCRTGKGSNQAIEFSGPYPITPREFRLLDDFRRDPSRPPTKL
ncbi:MAG TPA: hypothetical protein VF258_07230, partial [Luteolibacter sp.]